MKNTYFKQERNWTCGAAAMRIALARIKIYKEEGEIIRELGTNKIRGTWHKSFSEYSEKLKLDYLSGRNSNLKEINKLLKNKYIIIICYYIFNEKVDHYAVVKNLDKTSISLSDPFYGDNYKINLKIFVKSWRSDPRWDNEKSWFFAIRQKTNKPRHAV